MKRKLLSFALGTILVPLGLFHLFSLAFNGGVGEPFVNVAFFASGVLMIALGICKFTKAGFVWIIILASTTALSYIPMIWQRFQFEPIEIPHGLRYDAWVMALLLASMISEANPASKRISHGR